MFASLNEKTPNNAEGGDFMERELDISGIDEQNLPGAVAVNEQQVPVDDAFIEAMRVRDKAIVEVGSQPTTHPLVVSRTRKSIIAELEEGIDWV